MAELLEWSVFTQLPVCCCQQKDHSFPGVIGGERIVTSPKYVRIDAHREKKTRCVAADQTLQNENLKT